MVRLRNFIASFHHIASDLLLKSCELSEAVCRIAAVYETFIVATCNQVPGANFIVNLFFVFTLFSTGSV